MLTFERVNRQKMWRELQGVDLEAYPADYWEREDFLEKDLVIYAIFNRGYLVGWVGFWLNMKFPVTKGAHWRHKGCLYIGGISIRPEFLCEGVVKKVVAFVLEHADDAGMTELSTNERKSHEILPLLKKSGFYTVATTKGYWEKPSEPNVVLRLAI